MPDYFLQHRIMLTLIDYFQHLRTPILTAHPQFFNVAGNATGKAAASEKSQFKLLPFLVLIIFVHKATGRDTQQKHKK